MAHIFSNAKESFISILLVLQSAMNVKTLFALWSVRKCSFTFDMESVWGRSLWNEGSFLSFMTHISLDPAWFKDNHQQTEMLPVILLQTLQSWSHDTNINKLQEVIGTVHQSTAQGKARESFALQLLNYRENMLFGMDLPVHVSSRCWAYKWFQSDTHLLFLQIILFLKT